jgi:hypothetical protein
MALYLYKCDLCGQDVRKRFSMNGIIPGFVTCCEHLSAHRIFGVVQLNTQPAHLRDENKWGTLPPGAAYSEKDLLQQRRDDAARYERNREKKVGPGLTGA